MTVVSRHMACRCTGNRVLAGHLLQGSTRGRGICTSYSRKEWQHGQRCHVAVAEGSAGEAARLECYSEVWKAPKPSRMIADGRAFEEEHRVRGYEVGPNRKSTMITIANLLQEVASNHVVSMWGRSDEGFATDPEMAKEGLIFVMTRMQIQMDSYPAWGDIVHIETWFKESGRMRAQRDWVVRNSDGVEIGRATSTWVTISMKTRRLVRLPDRIRERFSRFRLEDGEDALSEERSRLKLPDLMSDEEVNVLPQIARMSDMDMNGHINNVTYIGWVLETVPEEMQNEKQLYQIEIDYKNECTSGDVVHPLAEESDTPDVFKDVDTVTYVHSLTRHNDAGSTPTELIRARTMWRA